MQQLSILVLVLIIISGSRVTPQNFDYYWRDYYGKVPEDALPIAKDINGDNTYLGQAYIHNYGLFIGQIFPGAKVVEVPCHGIRRVTSDLKILCTRHKDNFIWLPVSATTFHTDTIGKHVVVGGRTFANKAIANLNIGRIMKDGILKIGAVPDRDSVIMYYPHKGQQEKVSRYEVLIYENHYNIDARIS